MQFDAGVRYTSDRAHFELMLYTLDYTDRITSVLTGEVTPEGRDIVQSVNAADSTVRGFEGGASFDLNDTISLEAVLNYTWSEEQIPGSPTEPGDRIPPLSGRLNVSYDAGGDFRLGAWLRFADEQDRLSSRDVRDIRRRRLAVHAERRQRFRQALPGARLGAGCARAHTHGQRPQDLVGAVPEPRPGIDRGPRPAPTARFNVSVGAVLEPRSVFDRAPGPAPAGWPVAGSPISIRRCPYGAIAVTAS